MFSMCFNAVDEVMDHAVADLIAKLVVVHEDVSHRLCFQQLVSPQMGEMEILKKNDLVSFLVCMTKMDKDMTPYPWSEKKVQVFVQQNLVLRVSSTEVLEKRMCQGHDLIHLLITLCNMGTNGERKSPSGKVESRKHRNWLFGQFPTFS